MPISKTLIGAAGFFLFMGMVRPALGADGCFLIQDLASGKVLLEEGECALRYTPASTFKIALSLMGYDAGILEDATRPVWPFKKGSVDWLPSWRKPQNPTSWVKNSCVWYSQEITKKLETDRFRKYVHLFGYGNEDVSGDKKLDNGLTYSWLSSSLLISPEEQIAFLRKMLLHKFPISSRSYSMTTHLFHMGDLGDGWKLYGKTGTGFQLYADGGRNTTKQIGWYVGWIAKDKRTFVFARLLKDRDPNSTYAGPRAYEDGRRKLEAFMAGLKEGKQQD